MYCDTTGHEDDPIRGVDGLTANLRDQAFVDALHQLVRISFPPGTRLEVIIAVGRNHHDTQVACEVVQSPFRWPRR